LPLWASTYWLLMNSLVWIGAAAEVVAIVKVRLNTSIEKFAAIYD
jgi:hypothetical protein